MRRIKDKGDENFRLKWTELKSAINYGAFKEGKTNTITSQLVSLMKNASLQKSLELSCISNSKTLTGIDGNSIK